VAKPDVTMLTLEQFDMARGLDVMWGRGVTDPALSVFEKTANAADADVETLGKDIVWRGRNFVIKAADVAKLAKDSEAMLEMFNEKFALSFQKNPVVVFKSLPDTMQATLANMIRTREASE